MQNATLKHVENIGNGGSLYSHTSDIEKEERMRFEKDGEGHVLGAFGESI